MNQEESFDALVGRLYEAAVVPELWNAALLDMSAWIGADAFHLFAWDQAEGRARLALVSHPHFVDVIRKFDDYYGKVDVVRERALSVAPGEFFVTQNHFDDSFVRRNEWFQDFLIPNGMCWSTGGTVPIEQGVHTVLAMLRANDRGRYNDDELVRARRLWGHFQRASSLFVQTESLRQQSALGQRGLDHMEVGVVSTDHRGYLLYANRQAEAIVGASGMLRVRNGFLGAADPTADGTLRAAIALAATKQRSTSLPMVDPHPGRAELFVTVSPLRDSSSAWSVLHRPAVLVLLRSRGRQRMLTGQQLVQLFRLTPAEARLARAMTLGRMPEEFATDCGLSMATVRTQLRKVFEKTGTRRQPELIRLLASIPPTR